VTSAIRRRLQAALIVADMGIFGIVGDGRGLSLDREEIGPAERGAAIVGHENSGCAVEYRRPGWKECVPAERTAAKPGPCGSNPSMNSSYGPGLKSADRLAGYDSRRGWLLFSAQGFFEGPGRPRVNAESTPG